MERSDPRAAGLRAQRFGLRRATFTEAMRRLLGTHAGAPLADAARAAALVAEFGATRETALPAEWALVSHEWAGVDVAELVDTVHRLARNLGPRRVWLLALGADAQAVESDSATLLDNPLGFAAATDHELALLDGEVPGGLWLVRHSHQRGADVTFTWELQVWGEPWLSAATRALRGVG